MKKFTIVLAASLIALPAFAQKAAPKLNSAGTKPAPTAPKAPGGKIGTAPVAGSKSKPGTVAKPRVGIGSTSATAKAPGASAAKAGSICPANAASSKLSAQEKSVMARAEQAGVGGNSCASQLQSVTTAQTLASINAAGLRQLQAEGCTTVDSCSLAKKARVLDAKAAALAIRTGQNQKDALAALNKSDDMGCDFNGKLNDGAVRTAALSN